MEEFNLKGLVRLRSCSTRITRSSLSNNFQKPSLDLDSQFNLSDIVTLIMLRQSCYVGPMKYCVFTRNLSVLVNMIDFTFNIMDDGSCLPIL